MTMGPNEGQRDHLHTAWLVKERGQHCHGLGERERKFKQERKAAEEENRGGGPPFGGLCPGPCEVRKESGHEAQ